MIIEKKTGVMQWGKLDVSLCGAVSDIEGNELANPIGYSLAQDDEALWFIATHREAAALHPDSAPGVFLAKLWEYDVAEFFLTNPENGHYLEVNLAPNAAWWAAQFSGPREEMQELKLDGVNCYADMNKDGGWLAAIRIELSVLRERFAYSEQSMMNVTFILGSPEQKFVSVADLGGGEPDFHQPTKFRKIQYVDESKLRELTGNS